MKNKSLYCKKIIRNFTSAANYRLFEPSVLSPSFLKILRVNINSVYIILIIYFIFLIRYMIMKKSIALFSCLLFMIGFSHLFVIIVASPGDYSRLILPAIPIFLIMFGQLISYAIKKSLNICFE